MADLMQLFRRTLKHEGGFQNDPDDDGNWTGGKKGVGVNKGTKFGISAKQYPKEDIVGLTEERAIKIYLTDYYLPLKLEVVNSPKIRWKLFDIAINLGADDPPRIVRNVLASLGYVGGEYERLNDAEKFWGSDEVPLREIAEWQVRAYVDIVFRNPAKVKYLKTWVGRGFDIGEGL
jgi:hypothetical protein